MNDSGWKAIKPHITDSNHEFITELAQEIQREILLNRLPDLTMSKSACSNTTTTSANTGISSSYTYTEPPSIHLRPSNENTVSRDPLFYISCPDIKPAKSRSHPQSAAHHTPAIPPMRVHKSAQRIRSSALKPPLQIQYPNHQSPTIRHVIAFPKNKRKPVLCSPYYAPQYMQSRRLTPQSKSLGVPDFSVPNMRLDVCDFGDIETKGGPIDTPANSPTNKPRQKRQRSHEKKRNKPRKLKQIIVSKRDMARSKTMPEMQRKDHSNKSKLRVYKKRDKCSPIVEHVEHQMDVNMNEYDDDRYGISSDDSDNESLYCNEGKHSTKGMSPVENTGGEGQEVDMMIQTGFLPQKTI
eukprot:493812_1